MQLGVLGNSTGGQTYPPTSAEELHNNKRRIRYKAIYNKENYLIGLIG